MRIINSFLALTCSVSLVAPAYAAGVGKGEGQVDIVAWPGYIERGDSDKNYDWVTEFREEDGLQGQCQDRRHVGRNGRADE